MTLAVVEGGPGLGHFGGRRSGPARPRAGDGDAGHLEEEIFHAGDFVAGERDAPLDKLGFCDFHRELAIIGLDELDLIGH